MSLGIKMESERSLSPEDGGNLLLRNNYIYLAAKMALVPTYLCLYCDNLKTQNAVSQGC
jgi:hypothetical protein